MGNIHFNICKNVEYDSNRNSLSSKKYSYVFKLIEFLWPPTCGYNQQWSDYMSEMGSNTTLWIKSKIMMNIFRIVFNLFRVILDFKIPCWSQHPRSGQHLKRRRRKRTKIMKLIFGQGIPITSYVTTLSYINMNEIDLSHETFDTSIKIRDQTDWWQDASSILGSSLSPSLIQTAHPTFNTNTTFVCDIWLWIQSKSSS